MGKSYPRWDVFIGESLGIAENEVNVKEMNIE